MSRRVWTAEEIRALGVRTDLLTAASVLGMGRTVAYDLARRGEFPVKVLRLGRRYVVVVASLLRLLELDGPGPLTLTEDDQTDQLRGVRHGERAADPAA